MNTPENPPAFPRPASPAAFTDNCQDGMTLRDYFAGQCNVEAYGPREAFHQNKGRWPKMEELAEYIADIRYIEADAMLAARSNQPA